MSHKLNLQHLLQNVDKIIKHHAELRKIKGEDFNIFAILRMQNKEVQTHSRFLAELLNPKGRHHFGSTFLKLFLNVVEHNKEGNKKKEFLVSDNVSVKVEKSIGKVDIEKGNGGFIDIYLKDEKGNSISIENKIYAGDQPKQLVRYHNHNKGKNTLYYLTLDNTKKVNDNSITYQDDKGKAIKLKENEDFFPITYKEHILTWLDLCLKETTEHPIIRETIKQYIILIKKLTHTMTKEEEHELAEAIFNNLDAAKKIATQYKKIINSYQDKLREAVLNKLNEELPNKEKYNIELGNNMESNFVQIWIYPKNCNPKIRYGIETFNGNKKHNDGNLFIGIYTKDLTVQKQLNNQTFLLPNWPCIENIKLADDTKINLGENKLLKMIYNENSNVFKEVVETICNQSVEFIKENEKEVFNLCTESNK